LDVDVLFRILIILVLLGLLRLLYNNGLLALHYAFDILKYECIYQLLWIIVDCCGDVIH